MKRKKKSRDLFEKDVEFFKTLSMSKGLDAASVRWIKHNILDNITIPPTKYYANLCEVDLNPVSRET